MDLPSLIQVCRMDIVEAPARLAVDTIVNAANVTLMGSEDNVDGAIHAKIDELNHQERFFDRQIKATVDKTPFLPDDIVRCRRGEVVETGGYLLCQKILHTVGSQSDQLPCTLSGCSSSTIDALENCYQNLVHHIYKDPSIRRVAIPVISSGNYGIDFTVAVKVAIASIYNTLLDYQRKDPELFGYCKLEKVYLIVLTQENEYTAQKVLESFQGCFDRGNRVVDRNSFEGQCQFLKEILLYDRQKGHFSFAKMFRLALVVLRTFLFPSIYLKDLLGRNDWERRRLIAECTTCGKMALPLLLYGLFVLRPVLGALPPCLFLPPLPLPGMEAVFCGILLYNLAGTVTYLLSLITLADIQKPSANVIRSLIMLLFNYIEVSLDISVISLLLCRGAMVFREALGFGLLGVEPACMAGQSKTTLDYLLLGLNQSAKFFLLTLALGYLTGHLRERKFRTR